MKTSFLAKIGISVAALTVAAALPSYASFTMTVNDGVGGPTTITDNGAGDLNAGVGAITFLSSDAKWSINVDTGTSKPLIGSATDPQLDLNFIATSVGAGTLTITITDTGFGPLGASTFLSHLSLGGTLASGGTVTGSGLVNLTTVGPVSTSTSPFALSASALAGGLGSTFDMSETITLTHTSGGISSGDLKLDVVPEPSTVIAGALLLLPFGASTLRCLRSRKTNA